MRTLQDEYYWALKNNLKQIHTSVWFFGFMQLMFDLILLVVIAR